MMRPLAKIPAPQAAAAVTHRQIEIGAPRRGESWRFRGARCASSQNASAQPPRISAVAGQQRRQHARVVAPDREHLALAGDEATCPRPSASVRKRRVTFDAARRRRRASRRTLSPNSGSRASPPSASASVAGAPARLRPGGANDAIRRRQAARRRLVRFAGAALARAACGSASGAAAKRRVELARQARPRADRACAPQSRTPSRRECSSRQVTSPAMTMSMSDSRDRPCISQRPPHARPHPRPVARPAPIGRGRLRRGRKRKRLPRSRANARHARPPVHDGDFGATRTQDRITGYKNPCRILCPGNC